MSSPKTQSGKASGARATLPRRKKAAKARSPRTRLVHIEVKRGEALCLRVAIAHGVMHEAGEELGALIRRISPGMPPIEAAPVGAPPETVETVVMGPELLIDRDHIEHDDVYHANLREHLVDLFRSLCDSALEDALTAARAERDRRAEGAN